MVLMLSFGCARSVTQIVAYGEQMLVEVTLRGTIEADANRYFLVLASSPNFKVPLPPPDNISYEFIEPGTEPRLGTSADYYANYYATWEGYVIAEPGGYFLVKGPFVSGVMPTREVITSLGEAGSQLKFNFNLSRIFGAAVPASIYFDFVSVPWPTDAAKLPADHLNSTNAYVSKVAGSTVPIDDETNPSLDPAADIIKCTVTIQ